MTKHSNMYIWDYEDHSYPNPTGMKIFQRDTCQWLSKQQSSKNWDFIGNFMLEEPDWEKKKQNKTMWREEIYNSSDHSAGRCRRCSENGQNSTLGLGHNRQLAPASYWDPHLMSGCERVGWLVGGWGVTGSFCFSSQWIKSLFKIPSSFHYCFV